MKTKNKENRKAQKINSPVKGHHYYFHADEDFREDHNWGKTKQNIGSKTDNEMSRGNGSR